MQQWINCSHWDRKTCRRNAKSQPMFLEFNVLKALHRFKDIEVSWEHFREISHLVVFNEPFRIYILQCSWGKIRFYFLDWITILLNSFIFTNMPCHVNILYFTFAFHIINPYRHGLARNFQSFQIVVCGIKQRKLNLGRSLLIYHFWINGT